MVPDGVAPPRVDRITLVISVVLLLLFGASVALVWQLGLFDENTRASNAQVIAAALALVGVLVTASLTFAGVLLKHSIDRRTVQQAAETEGPSETGDVDQRRPTAHRRGKAGDADPAGRRAIRAGESQSA